MVLVGGDGGKSSVGLHGSHQGGTGDSSRYQKKLFKIEMTTAKKGEIARNILMSNTAIDWKKSSNMRSTNYDDRAATPLQPYNRKRVQSIFTQSSQRA